MKYHVNFFRPEEFFCPCCGKGQPATILVYELDLFRRCWGMPVRVNSGFRCERHNKEVGGVMPSKLNPGSRHLLGLAADIAPLDPSLIGPFQNLASNLWGRRDGYELKLYPRFIHIAVPRGEEARTWDGSGIAVMARNV